MGGEFCETFLEQEMEGKPAMGAESILPDVRFDRLSKPPAGWYLGASLAD
jgi:hypothetical protein